MAIAIYFIVALVNVFLHVFKNILVIKSTKFRASLANCICYTFAAWSLSALLELMPKELEIALFKTPVSGEYFFSWWTDDNHMGDDYKDPVTTAYEMVVWLLENGYIERGGV